MAETTLGQDFPIGLQIFGHINIQECPIGPVNEDIESSRLSAANMALETARAIHVFDDAGGRTSKALVPSFSLSVAITTERSWAS